MGTKGSGTPQPVPTYKAPVGIDVTATQNVWYDVLNAGAVVASVADGVALRNVEVYKLVYAMQTLAEDIAVEIEVDGEVLAGAQGAAVAGTSYFPYVNINAAASDYLTTGTASILLGHYESLKCKTFRMAVRKTTANGANKLNGVCSYRQW